MQPTTPCTHLERWGRQPSFLAYVVRQQLEYFHSHPSPAGDRRRIIKGGCSQWRLLFKHPKPIPQSVIFTQWFSKLGVRESNTVNKQQTYCKDLDVITFVLQIAPQILQSGLNLKFIKEKKEGNKYEIIKSKGKSKTLFSWNKIAETLFSHAIISKKNLLNRHGIFFSLLEEWHTFNKFTETWNESRTHSCVFP